jgi:sigma-B regulation protein RsbU (phosphoserine phosphatase)
MASSAASRILLCADAPGAAEDVQRSLEIAGHSVWRHALDGPEPENPAAYHLILLEGTPGRPEIPQLCRRLRARLGDGFVPIVLVTSDPSPTVRLASFESGADGYLLRPFSPRELLAQVLAFLRIKELHDRLADRTAEVTRINKRLQLAYRHLDEELELARRIQQSFLPQELPELPGVRFAVHYRPCGRVGGDFYDLLRLDEQHVALYVADAMGHGVPASLLTIFLKKGVRPKEIAGQQYRLLPPGEVLEHLNRELLEHGLAENPFITMTYVLLNFRTGRLSFARAGHPHPLYVPRAGEPHCWEVHGSLLGVYETHFLTESHDLSPGDKLLLYTDGVDAAVLPGHEPGIASLRACAARHRELPLADFIDRLVEDLVGHSNRPDDLTLLGFEITEPAVPAA